MHRRALLEQNELTSGSTWHAAGLCTQFAASPQTHAPAQAQPRSLRRARGSHRPGRGPAPLRLGPAGRVRAIASTSSTTCSGIAAQVGVPVRDHRPRRRRCAAVPADGSRRGARGAHPSHRRPRRSLRRHQRAGRRSGRAGSAIHRHTPVSGLTSERRRLVVDTPRGERARRHRRQRRRAVGAPGGPAGGRRAADRPARASLRRHRADRGLAELEQELPVLRDPERLVLRPSGGRGAARRPVRGAGDAVGARRHPRGFPRPVAAVPTRAIEDVLVAAARADPRVRRRPGCRRSINGPDGYTPDGRCTDRPGAGRARLPRDRGLLDLRHRVRRRSRRRSRPTGSSTASRATTCAELDVRRFGDYASAKQLPDPEGARGLQREYAIEFPYEERPVARPLKTSPLYDRLRERGAVFGDRSGWERPLWFRAAGTRARSTATAAPSWYEAVGAECAAVPRRPSGVLDQTSFAKFEVSGAGAERLPRPPLRQRAAGAAPDGSRSRRCAPPAAGSSAT